VYFRDEVRADVAYHRLNVRTAYGLPEFDGISDQTSDLIALGRELGRRRVDDMFVVNPGQGHAAVALWLLLRPHQLTIADRDLLALRVTASNLCRHDCPPSALTTYHQLGLPGDRPSTVDLIVVTLRQDEGPAVNTELLLQALERLTISGIILVSGTSTAIARLEADPRVRAVVRVRHSLGRRGTRAVALERRRR
jgi:hypothetical protein